MKANVNKKSSILLSIGLIIKNEEKYLDDCLSALKPIQDAIPTEIVVVDTGSTDNSLKIAKKYTDEVYNFKWIDDFSAARNYGLEHCSGKWFMFIDADEIFEEDVSNLVNFLKSKESNNYDFARIHLKNYEDTNLESYNESIPLRMARKTNKTKFIRRIHECFLLEGTQRIFDIMVFAKHYGYIGKKKIDGKVDRNLKLLEQEYKENPKSTMTLSYLFLTSKNNKEKERYLNEWLEVEKNSENQNLSARFLIYATQYYSNVNVIKAIQYAEEFLSVEEYRRENASISVLLILSNIYMAVENYSKALECFHMYFDTYEKYLNNELYVYIDTVLSGTQKYAYEKQKLMLALCYLKQKEYSKMKSTLENFDIFEAISSDENFYTLKFTEILSLAFDEDFFTKYYGCFKEKFPKAANKLVTNCYWKIFKENNKALNKYLKVISKIENDNYMGLMFEILLQEKNQYDFVILVKSFLDTVPKLEVEYSPLLYKAIENNCSVSKLLSTLSRKELVEMIATINANLSSRDYEKIAKTYIETNNYETLQELNFLIVLLNPIKKTNSETYITYGLMMANYVTNVYSSEVLNDDDIKMLPDWDRFGYYIYLADKAKSEGDDLHYIRALRYALKAEPDFKEVAEEITEELGKRLFED